MVHHRLRPQHIREQPRLLADHPAHALDRRVLVLQRSARGRRGVTRVWLAREGQGFEPSVAIDHHPIVVDRVQLRPAGNAVSDRIHFRGLCALSEDREAVLRIIAGDDSGQHQWHARLRRVGVVLLQSRRRAEQVGIGDGREVDPSGVHWRVAHPGSGTAAAGGGQIGQDQRGLHGERDHEEPGRNPWPIAQQPRTPAIARRESVEPGSGVHGRTGMSFMVVLEAPRARAPVRTRRRAGEGAAAQSYGCGPCALKRLFLQE